MRATPLSTFYLISITPKDIMKTFITSMAVAMLLAVTANADVIHSTDYEADGAAAGPGTTLGVQPASMEFTDGGGDFVGQAGLGLSDVTANSGSYSYVIDTSATVDNGNGWGGNWSGINTTSGQTSGGIFGSQAAAVAAGPGSQYIDYSAGATFTVSVFAATDAAGVTSAATVGPRLEFFGAGGEVFRADGSGRGTPQIAASSLTETFQLLTQTYTIVAGDNALPNGAIERVAAVVGSDGLGFSDTTGGNIYLDDLTFEINSANVITVPAVVPEPATATLLLAGLMGLCGVRRRKS